ncbi:MAG: hypothetical protein ACJ76F_12540 [Bacteroidia bacterium]
MLALADHVKNGFFLFLILACGQLFAQSFELEQIEQIWRPRIRLDTKYTSDSKFSDTTGKYNALDASGIYTFPIKSKFAASLQLDLSSLKLKDMAKNSVQVKAYQVMGSIRAGSRQISLGFDSISQRRLYYASASVFGLKLTRKYRILFYSLNAGLSEEDKTMNRLTPRFTGILGQFHLKGIRKNYYYGIMTTYSDGVFVPVPFFGGMVPFGNNCSFNFTFPAQAYVQYRSGKKTSFSLGATIDGYRSGIQYNNSRLNINYGTANAFVAWKQKLNKTFGFRIETGYCVKQYLNFSDGNRRKAAYPINPGFYGQISITTLLGKSLFEQVSDGLNSGLF